MQLRHQCLGAYEHGLLGSEAIRGVVRKHLLDPHVARLVAELASLEPIARRPRTAVRQLVAYPLPRVGLTGDHGRPSMHIDFQLGQHAELAMRLLELQTRDDVAERIDHIATSVGCRRERKLKINALLVSRWAG